MSSGKKPHRGDFRGKLIIALIFAANLKQTSNVTGDMMGKRIRILNLGRLVERTSINQQKRNTLVNCLLNRLQYVRYQRH